MSASCLRSLALAAALLVVANAGQYCFPKGANDPSICVMWASTDNATTIVVTCDPGSGTMGPILNWCGFGINPTAQAKMYPAETYLLIPDVTGTSLVVENRLNKAHATPLCYPTSFLTLINSTITANPTSGGYVLEASFTRPRYLDDPDIIAEGHVNLTGTAGPPTSLIGAGSQAPYTKYAPCDAVNLEYHTYYATGGTVNWDL